MAVLAALVVGYVMGAKTKGRELDQLGRTLKALYDTDEFADVVTAARAQVGAGLRELAAVIDGHGAAPEAGEDLVSRVRTLVGRE
jgi:hypothetical protein